MAGKGDDSRNYDGLVYFPTSGKELRKAEEQLLIPNRLRKFALHVCEEEWFNYKDCQMGFGLKGALLGICREKKRKMEACVSAVVDDPAAWEEVKKRYLVDREEHQQFMKKYGEQRQREIDEYRKIHAAVPGKKAKD